jgi:AraC-like DNA-binding protein
LGIVRNATEYAPRITSTFKIALIADRPKRYLYERKAYVAPPGALILAAAGALHGAEVAGDPYQATVISIDEAVVGARIDVHAPVTISALTLARFHALASRLMDPGSTPLAVDDAVAALLGVIARTSEGRPPSRARDRVEVQRARELLRERATEPVRLDDLAREVRMPALRFARAFKRMVGVPPHEYQLQVRVDLARRLIARGERIVDVAVGTGFCDQSHLHRHFVRIVGVAPGAYRSNALR